MIKFIMPTAFSAVLPAGWEWIVAMTIGTANCTIQIVNQKFSALDPANDSRPINCRLFCRSGMQELSSLPGSSREDSPSFLTRRDDMYFFSIHLQNLLSCRMIAHQNREVNYRLLKKNRSNMNKKSAIIEIMIIWSRFMKHAVRSRPFLIGSL